MARFRSEAAILSLRVWGQVGQVMEEPGVVSVVIRDAIGWVKKARTGVLRRGCVVVVVVFLLVPPPWV